MANYEKPTVQFRPRNKAEARQWRRDRAQLRYERNWKRTSKTHNPLTGKKNYSAPKAEIYQSKDLQKSQTQYRKGNRSYRPTPRFGGTVFGLVSLILAIGLLASMFFVVQNKGRSEGEPFVYFSPSVFLDNISSDGFVIPAETYNVELEYEKKWYQFDGKYWGYIQVGDRRIKSGTFINEFNINNADQSFFFVINGERYNSIQVEIQGPTIDGEPLGIARKVVLPEITVEWGSMPELGDLVDHWEGIDSIGSLGNALGETAYFVHDWLKYQSNLLLALLPWNSAVSSADVPTDGAKVDIPWRGSNNEIIEGQL